MAKIYCKSSYLLRRDTAGNWQNKNPILRKGEQGLETDTGIMKIGDGATEYNSLSDDNIYSPKSRINKSVDDVKSYANSTFANALKGSKSGSAILIDDISPVTHEMGVKVRGKNLIPYPYYDSSTSSVGATITVNEDRSISFSGTPTSYIGFVLYKGNALVKSGTFTLSVGNLTNIDTSLFIYDSSGATIHTIRTNKNITINADDYPTAATWNITMVRTASNVEISGTAYPQLELGTTSTPYTPYVPDLTAVKVTKSNASGEAVAEYTPNADGTVNGVTSLYPNTTLTTDTDGVLIDCEYNRDINKAFAELQQAIISLGGNV